MFLACMNSIYFLFEKKINIEHVAENVDAADYDNMSITRQWNTESSINIGIKKQYFTDMLAMTGTAQSTTHCWHLCCCCSRC